MTSLDDDALVERFKRSIEQTFERAFKHYLDALSADAITYREIKNGRIRADVRLLNGRRRRVFADSYPAARQAVAEILHEVVVAQCQGVSVRTVRTWERQTRAS